MRTQPEANWRFLLVSALSGGVMEAKAFCGTDRGRDWSVYVGLQHSGAIGKTITLPPPSLPAHVRWKTLGHCCLSKHVNGEFLLI